MCTYTYLQEVLPDEIPHVVYIGMEGIARYSPILLELGNSSVATEDRNLERVGLFRTVPRRQPKVCDIVLDGVGRT